MLTRHFMGWRGYRVWNFSDRRNGGEKGCKIRKKKGGGRRRRNIKIIEVRL